MFACAPATCDRGASRIVDSLAEHANNRNVLDQPARRLSAPVHEAHAGRSSACDRAQRMPETTFAIAVDGEAVGGIGFVLHPDVERVSAEIGYWLGEPFWGRGIATEALARHHRVCHRDARADAPVRASVCAQRRVVPGARESRLCARGAAAAERHQGRRRSPIRCSMRSSRRKTIGRDPKAQAESAILGRVRVPQRAPGAVRVEVPAAAANHALLTSRRTARIDAAPAVYAAYNRTSTPTRCRACRKAPTDSAAACPRRSAACG